MSSDGSGQDGVKTLLIKVQSASGLAKRDLLGTSDPYVRVSQLDSGQNIVHEEKTKHVKKSLNPVWNEMFTFSNVNSSRDKLLFRVFDQNRVTRDDFLGQVSLSLKEVSIQHLDSIEAAQKYSLQLKNKPGKQRSGVKGKLYVSLCYKADGTRPPHLGATLSVNGDTRASTLSIAENGAQDEDEETLPQGWEARIDSVGRTYYIDHSNKVTQWEHPRVTMARYSAGVRPMETSSVRRQRMQTMPRRQLSEAQEGPRPDSNDDNDSDTAGDSTPTPEPSSPVTPSPIPVQAPAVVQMPQPQPANSSPTSAASPGASSGSSSGTMRGRDPRNKSNDPILANLSTSLTPGWEARYAPNGRVFFIDHNTRQTAWSHPVTGQTHPPSRPSQTAQSTQSSPSPAIQQSLVVDPLAPVARKPNVASDQPLPAGWEMRIHQNRPFFINHNNRATQWEDPRVFGARSGGAVPYNRDYKRKYETLMRSMPPKPGPPAKLDLPVRRNTILDDSYRCIINLKNLSLLRSRLYVKFDDEKGLDYGGLSREWFMLLSHEMFNPYYCLFEYSANDSYTLQINPNSGFCNEHHLHYFKFIGRVCAMAVYHQKLIDAFFIRPFYKLLVDRPIKVEDMEIVDPEYHNSLQYILENDPDDLDLYFTLEEESFGEVKTFSLKKDGESIQVTNANKKEYVNLIIKHRFENRIKDQLKCFKEGFSDVFPVQNLKIFDEKELEYLMCGLAEIDTADWRNNTDYRHYNPKDQVVLWFWQVVASYDNEMRARLLQFATGTSRLPMNGFAELYGSNGQQKFCLSKVGQPDNLPVAHTCFNRIDLPPYRCYNDLKDKLTYAIENTGGFNID